MPNWLVNIVLPYVIPVLVQGLSPIIVEYIKKAAQWYFAHVPASVAMVTASVVAEGVNQASQWLLNASLPFGVAPLVAILINEVGADFGKQPPTPGVK